MPFRIAATKLGPLANFAGSLVLPAALNLKSNDPHYLCALTDSGVHAAVQSVWAILPAATPPPARAFPRFDTVDDWQSGLTLLVEQSANLRASASAEISALWTSLAAPVKSILSGDIGLDLDLGIQAQAQWCASSDCWWSIHRPSAARTLELRLCAARTSARSLNVTAGATAGLDQATRNSVAAILGHHRTQLLQSLRRGAAALPGKLPFPKRTIAAFVENWLALPDAVRNEQWSNPVDPVLRALKRAVERAIDTTLANADQLTARLEFAAVRTLEKSLSASLSAAFDRQRSSGAILHATFDFDANPALDPIFQSTREGDLQPLLAAPVNGVTLHSCAITTELARRRTFSWRLPFTAGYTDSRERLETAMLALDDAAGRVIRGRVRVDSERRTRHAASLLSLEAAFAARLGGDITVHDPASLRASFDLHFRTNRPRALQPLMDLYKAGRVPPDATRCHLQVSLPPDAIAHWLSPQPAAEVSRRIQIAWRTLLPAVVDIEALNTQTAAPLLVWMSLPVTTRVSLDGPSLTLNREGASYWDWADPRLRDAMVWNPRTAASLQANIANSPFDATPDELRRILTKPVGTAVFQSLLRMEAVLVDAIASQLELFERRSADPVKAMRELSEMLSKLTLAFHRRLSSVYGAETARALGPLLLAATSGVQPEASVTWAR